MSKTELAVLGPLEQLRAPRLPRRLIQLFIGLVLYGVTMGCLVRAQLGLDPWDVLHAGIAKHTSLSFGTTVIVVGVIVLLAWIPIRQMPGLGTVANAVVVGLAADATLGVLHAPDSLVPRVLLLIVGIVGNAFAGALYIGSQLGPGPRDGLMTGLARRTGRSIRLVRTLLEVSVLATGFLLGGAVGVGTVLYALSIGPLVGWMLPWCTADLGVTRSEPVELASARARPAGANG